MLSERFENWSNAEWLAALSGEGPLLVTVQKALLAMLCRGLRRAFSSRPEALNCVEDFAQEAMLSILRDLPAFRGESRFSTWALSIAMHLALDELRRSRWKDVSLDSLLKAGERHHPARGPAPERKLGRQQILDMLQYAIASSLTDKQRIALVAEFKGMPQAEIARHLGSTRNAVYKLTHDARRTLRKVFEEVGLSGEMVLWAFTADQSEE